jgi:hypothetical protein
MVLVGLALLVAFKVIMGYLAMVDCTSCIVGPHYWCRPARRWGALGGGGGGWFCLAAQ